MDTIGRLKQLSSQMHLEPAEETVCSPVGAKQKEGVYISQAAIPGGKSISLLKTLLTSACERNCFYCPFRAGRDYRRATMKPDEMAHTFLDLHQSGAVQGLFLSSGIVAGGINTQEKLNDTAEILRKKLGYRGYLHLKIMPGAERGQVERAMLLADRLSINLEAPNTQRLMKLAPRKQFFEELFQPLRWIDEIRRSQPSYKGWNGRWPSTTTQFVVGAVGESDLELLETTEKLFQQVHLWRPYYSAFDPIRDTPFENLPSESPLRQFRLYQASFLLRDYGFTMEELPFQGEGSLPLDNDPKLAWAQVNLKESPVEINTASRQELLRVPGFGPKSTDAILKARRQGQRLRLHELIDLRRIGVNPSRAAPYILLNGRRPAFQTSFL